MQIFKLCKMYILQNSNVENNFHYDEESRHDETSESVRGEHTCAEVSSTHSKSI